MNQTASPLRTILYGAEIFFAGLILSKLLAYVFRLIIARLGVEYYGAFSIALAVVGMLTVIAVFGLDIGVLRFMSRHVGNQKTENRIFVSAFKVTSFLSVLLMFLLIFFSDTIASVFNEPLLSSILKVLALSIPFDSVRSLLIAAAKSFRKVQYELYSKELLGNLLLIIFTLIFIYAGLELFGVALAYVLAMAISAVYLFYLLHRFRKHIFQIPEKERNCAMGTRHLVSFSWPLVFSALIIFLMTWVDSIILGLLKDSYAVGLYNAAAPSAKLILMFPQAIMVLFIPALAGLVLQRTQKSRDEASRITSFIAKWNMMIMLAVLGFFIIFGKQFLALFFGVQYAQASSALVILSFGLFFAGLYYGPREMLYILKQTKAVLIITLAGLLANIFLNILLIPKYGINGAAFASSSAYILMAVFMASYCQHKSGIGQFRFPLFKLLLAIMPPILIILYLYRSVGHSLLSALFYALLFFLLFLLFLILLRAFGKEDIRLIKTIKGQIRNKIRLTDNAESNINPEEDSKACK